MDFQYFKWQGDDALAEIRRFQALNQVFRETCVELAKEYGAYTTAHRGSSAIGLIFREPPEKTEGLRLEQNKVTESTLSLGKGQSRLWIATPDRRYKRGKQLEALLQAITQTAQTEGAHEFSSWFIRSHGLGRNIAGCNSDGKMALFYSVAGMYPLKKLIVAQLPVGVTKGDLPVDPDPSIPDYLQEIKKSEFIALTEES